MMPALNQPSSVTLFELLKGFELSIEESLLSSITATGLCLDSRKVEHGDIFFALSGTQLDGSRFIKDAISSGAIAVVHEKEADDFLLSQAKENQVPLIHDTELRSHLGEIAARFYNHPAKRMQVIGVTGTDGKTSVTHFIAQVLDRSNQDPNSRAAVIGTVGSGLYGELELATHTTPDALTLQASLSSMLARGAQYVAMETSSHGLQQGRVNGIQFELAVLTNLGRDHLDYHGDLESYQNAKRRLFQSPGLQGAVLNWHDPFGKKLLSDFSDCYPISIYGLNELKEIQRSGADDWVCGRQLVCTATGFNMHVHMPDVEFDLSCDLVGEFNALNVLATAAVLRRLGWPAESIATGLAQLRSVAGRMQVIKKVNQPTVVIDYAHTPQALRSALNAVRGHCESRLWCVFGCGGDRDAGKRPQMGGIAEALADRIIITNDNPRHEAPERIAEEIQEGMHDRSGVLVLLDRADAIKAALEQAGPDDLVLLAGKGHETTQQIGDEFLFFNDQLVVDELLGGAQ